MVVAEVANNLSIFGVVEVIAIIGVVEEVVTSKRVDGLVFTFSKSGGSEKTRERMFSLDKESTRSFTRLSSSNCNAST